MDSTIQYVNSVLRWVFEPIMYIHVLGSSFLFQPESLTNIYLLLASWTIKINQNVGHTIHRSYGIFSITLLFSAAGVRCQSTPTSGKQMKPSLSRIAPRNGWWLQVSAVNPSGVYLSFQGLQNRSISGIFITILNENFGARISSTEIYLYFDYALPHSTTPP